MSLLPRNVATLVLAVVVAVGFATPVAAGAALPQQQAEDACDYTELYEDTIDSVVSVQQRGGQGSGFVYAVGEDGLAAGASDAANATEDPSNDTGNATNASTGATSYVVTNAHVVGTQRNVTVQFGPGESRTGTVVGADVSSDLAVVAVNDTPEGVEAIPVASEQPDHGEPVAALGSPLGLDETITQGIVSGLNRSMPTELGFTIPNVVQTDAPISPGNSGGPLVTCDGEVVGVNTAGIAAAGAENIGFAVSATTVERVVPELIETGEYDHPTLGISGTEVTPAIAERNDLEEPRGVIVGSVAETAPAADVLQGAERLELIDGEVVPVGGDVIVAVAGQNVSTVEDLASVLERETRPGDEVELTVVRDGERTTVTTTVTARPAPEGTGLAPTTPGPDTPGPDAPEPGPDTPEPGPDTPEPSPDTPEPGPDTPMPER